MPSCSSQDVDRFIETLPSYDAVFYKALASNDHTWVYPGKSHHAITMAQVTNSNTSGYHSGDCGDCATPPCRLQRIGLWGS